MIDQSNTLRPMFHLQRLGISQHIYHKSNTLLLSPFHWEISNNTVRPLARAAKYPCKVMDAELVDKVEGLGGIVFDDLVFRRAELVA